MRLSFARRNKVAVGITYGWIESMASMGVKHLIHFGVMRN